VHNNIVQAVQYASVKNQYIIQIYIYIYTYLYVVFDKVRAVKSDVIILSPPAILRSVIIIMHYRCHTNPLYALYTRKSDVGKWINHWRAAMGIKGWREDGRRGIRTICLTRWNIHIYIYIGACIIVSFV